MEEQITENVSQVGNAVEQGRKYTDEEYENDPLVQILLQSLRKQIFGE